MRNVLGAMTPFVAILGSFAVIGAAQAPQAGLIGNWRAEFTGPMGPRPQMVTDVVFTFRQTSTGLSGTAKTEPEWPGDLDVTEIKVDGDKFSFVGTGRRGWSVNGEKHCCPRLTFAGTIKADTMTLTMTWTSTENPNDPAGRTVPMEAKRVP